MAVKLETETIRVMALFEQVTRVDAKDCIITENGVTFLVDPEKVGMAVGRDGVQAKELGRLLKRPVKVIGYFGTAEGFIRHVIPFVEDIHTNNGTVMVSVPPQERTKAIGRNGSNIKLLKEILSRHFGIKNVRLR